MARCRRLARLTVHAAGVLSIAAAFRTAPASANPPLALTKGPYLTGLSESGVEVRFELNGAAPASLEVDCDGAGGSPPHKFDDEARTAMHVLRTSELAAATRYGYVVRADNRVVGRGSFTTAPRDDSGAQLKFLVYGDDRTDPAAHAAVARALASSPSDFLVNTGDMVEDGGRAEDWQSFFDVEAQLLRDRPLFVAIGNHELYDDRSGANFARYFGFSAPSRGVEPYGTVRMSNVRFFFLNSFHDWSSGQERQWLERELSRSDAEPGLKWRIAVMHQGPWSSGPHGANGPFVAAHVPELLVSHGVDLVFAGHDHIYERGEGVGMKYVISGGGGAPLYRASKTPNAQKLESTYHFVEVTTDRQAVHLLARRVDGSVLDECAFKKGENWQAAAGDEIAIRPESSAGDALPRAALGAEPKAPVAAAQKTTVVAASPLPTTSSARANCACELQGARSPPAPALLLVAAAMAAAVARRRGSPS